MDQFMGLVTEMGYYSFFKIIVIVFLLGYDFRKGFIFLHLLLWTGVLSEILKSLFGYPRPVDVDSTLRRIKENVDFSTPFTKMGAKGFWQLLPAEPVEFFRKIPNYSSGIPSGHASSATAVWSAVSMFSKKIWVYYFSGFMIVLMAISRMYLGRHFLADVTAGFILGMLVSLFFYFTFIRDERLDKTFPLKPIYNLRFMSILKYLYFFIFPFSILLLHQVDVSLVGNIIAFNLSFFLISLNGIPEFKGKLYKRIFRVLTAFIIYQVSAFIYHELMVNIIHFEGVFSDFISAFITVFLMIYGTVKLSPLIKIDK
jgi:membrane-associated phospholipid phosphatase